MNSAAEGLRAHWREIAGTFLKIGAMSYGGPAIMGLMQVEIQERRSWLSKERFIEGLALVNMLPGAGATQLGIFLGYTRAGGWGGLLAGLCFVLPAFFIMLALTLLYAQFGARPEMRGVFYGLNPVVVALFAVAVIRLGRNAIKDWKQAALGVAGALALAFTPLGIVPILLLAGAAGVALYAAPRWGAAAALVTVALYGALAWLRPQGSTLAWLGLAGAALAPGILQVGLFFFVVGAFTFGGGLSMLAFMQEQVVNQFQWLTPQEFLDGLALGQLTPGPILMLAAFVGYKLGDIGGAIVGAVAIFLPSFILMLSILPVFERIQRIRWMKAALRGISPVVIGMIAVALLQMLPNALPDLITAALALATVAALLLWHTSPLMLMAGGGGLGLLLS
jgi:chromate transporter